MDDNFMQYVMEMKRLQEENFQVAHKDINIPPQASSMNPSMAIMTDEITEENDDGGVSVTMDAVNEETPFLPSWRVYWGAKTSSKETTDETSGTTTSGSTVEYGWKIWNPKVVLDGKDIEVENGDILLDVSKDKDSQGTWYIGLFQESDTVVKVIHSSDNLMSSANMLIPLCQVIEDGNAIRQYHVGVVIIGKTIGCFDVSADKKRYLNPYYRVEQYIFQLADTTIPVKKGLHVIKINNETGGAQIEVLEDGISNLTDDTVDYSSSYIPLYLVEIGKDEDGKECITSMIDFRNIPTAQALLAVAS